jgi:hypothetical protein
VGILIACTLFFVLGAGLVTRAGLEIDELLFAGPLYQRLDPGFGVTVFHHRVPLMVMSYIGTLKTLLYWPVFRIFGSSVFSVRLPMVFVGSLTIFLFYRLSVALAGGAAAVLASLLLASDPIFLMTDSFDWGPVALQQLLLVAGCLLIVKRQYGFGCFLFGLALWNKALFLWVLAGLGAGSAVAYPRLVWAALHNRELIKRAAFGFVAGALPFLIFNIHIPNATLGSNASFSTENFGFKVFQMESALNGSGVLGFIPMEDYAPGPKSPHSTLGRFVFWIRKCAGEHRTSLFPYAIVAALLLSPLWLRSPARKAALFAITFSIVTFLAMLVCRGGGMGVHHTVFLWPMPHLLVGIALTCLRPRWMFWIAGSILVASNLLVINQYFYQFERNGVTWQFTDALIPLNRSLLPDQHVYVLDWNILDNLDVLRHGKLDLRLVTDIFLTAAPSATDQGRIAAAFADPKAVFVSHVRRSEAFRGVGEHLESAARTEGYEKAMCQIIPDSHGRPIFELFRVHSLSPGLSGR